MHGRLPAAAAKGPTTAAELFRIRWIRRRRRQASLHVKRKNGKRNEKRHSQAEDEERRPGSGDRACRSGGGRSWPRPQGTAVRMVHEHDQDPLGMELAAVGLLCHRDRAYAWELFAQRSVLLGFDGSHARELLRRARRLDGRSHALGLRLFRLVVCARQRDDRLLRDPHGLAPHEGRDGSSSHQSSQDHGRRRLSGGARGLDLPRGPASSPLPDDPSGRAGRHPRRQPRLGHPPLHRRRTLHGAFRLAHCSRPFASDGLPVGRRRGAHRPLHLLLVHRSRGPSPQDQAPRGGARTPG